MSILNQLGILKKFYLPIHECLYHVALPPAHVHKI
uniref:Uncharacterized protein n=1 Tax=Rhizophora mucronata TaxID=61149 RepID=A0A2P2LDV2_RHIMU